VVFYEDGAYTGIYPSKKEEEGKVARVDQRSAYHNLTYKRNNPNLTPYCISSQLDTVYNNRSVDKD
jgi:hypothetical protein